MSKYGLNKTTACANVRKTATDIDSLNLPDMPTIVSKSIAFNHELYLTDEIMEPFYYNQWVSVIKNAGENDVITIHVNSPGGVLDTGIQLYGALMASDATVCISIEGGCCSAATMIMMAADELYIDNNAYFMFHAYTGGRYGKFNSLQEDAKFQEKWFPAISKDIYKDFLTDQEMDDLLNGKDFWLDAQDVKKRYELLLKRRQLNLIKQDPTAALRLAAMGISIEDLEAEVNGEEPKSAKKPAKKGLLKKPAKKPAKEKAPAKKTTEKDTSKKKTPAKDKSTN